jgi:membrane protein implicated in regulation of membrane protease activity
MTYSTDRQRPTWRLVWVGVIAFVAAVLSRLWTESLLGAVLIGVLAAVISIAVVWFIDRSGRPRDR